MQPIARDWQQVASQPGPGSCANVREQATRKRFSFKDTDTILTFTKLCLSPGGFQQAEGDCAESAHGALTCAPPVRVHFAGACARRPRAVQSLLARFEFVEGMSTACP